MVKKCGWLFIGVIFLCSLFLYIPSSVKADSGWDSDYSSSDWDSDYSSSDWSYSSSDGYSDYDSSGSSSDGAGFAIILVFIIIIVICVLVAKSQKKAPINAYVRAGDQDELVRKYFPGLNERDLLENLVQKFIDVQNAWSNFDYDALKRLCTKELFETYQSDLEILSAKHQKNVMSQFRLQSVDLKSIVEENGLIIVSIYLHMSFYDYVVDDKNLVVRGNSSQVHYNQYHLDYVISKDHKGKCPNCGADIQQKAKCPYCASPISNMYSDFVLSKKSRIG